MKTLLPTETRLFGELLRDRGMISDEDLKNALALQQERRDKIGRILVDLGYVAERDVIKVLSDQLHVPAFTGEYPAVPIEPTKLPYRFLKAFHAVPVHLENDVLSLSKPSPNVSINFCPEASSPPYKRSSSPEISDSDAKYKARP